MQTIAQATAFTDTRDVTVTRRSGRTTGMVLSTLAVLFLTFDSIGKLLEAPAVIEASVQLGYPAGTVFSLGIILLLCVATYVIPRTSVLGAVLLTGYLGGAVATHVRVESPLFTHTLFPIFIAAFVWGGLLLRDARLRALVLRREHETGFDLRFS